MMNLPPHLCEVCGEHKRKRKNGFSHAKCSQILQQRRITSKLDAVAERQFPKRDAPTIDLAVGNNLGGE